MSNQYESTGKSDTTHIWINKLRNRAKIKLNGNERHMNVKTKFGSIKNQQTTTFLHYNENISCLFLLSNFVCGLLFMKNRTDFKTVTKVEFLFLIFE